MQTVHTVSQVREYVRGWHQKGLSVGFVPTMGNLHDGHISLMKEARARCDVVVVSIFVNPTQFGPNEDFDRYPRTLARDAELLALGYRVLHWRWADLEQPRLLAERIRRVLYPAAA